MVHSHGHGYTSINTPGQTQGVLGITNEGEAREKREFLAGDRGALFVGVLGGSVGSLMQVPRKQAPAPSSWASRTGGKEPRKPLFMPQPESSSYHAVMQAPQHI